MTTTTIPVLGGTYGWPLICRAARDTSVNRVSIDHLDDAFRVECPTF